MRIKGKARGLKKPVIKSWMISNFLDDGAPQNDMLQWQPADRVYFDFWMQLSIGIAGEAGADDFNVHVTSQKMLPQIDCKKNLLVVPYFESIQQIVDLLEQSIEQCTGDGWAAISACIAKMYYWGYQDYNKR